MPGGAEGLHYQSHYKRVAVFEEVLDGLVYNVYLIFNHVQQGIENSMNLFPC